MAANDSTKSTLSIVLFPCGNGDTVLLRLPGGGWVLVDCHLPKSDGTYDRFISFMTRQGVTRLEAVFLTHTDQDHLLGMGDILLAFASQDSRGRPTLFVDGGFDPRELQSYFKNRPGKSSFDKLMSAVEKLAAEKGLDWRSVNEHSYPIPLGHDHLGLDLLPIAPSQYRARTTLRAHAESLGNKTTAPLRLNDCSIILAVRKRTNTSWNALLTGDAGTSAIDEALEHWIDVSKSGENCMLRVIKIPHHGSRTSLSKKLIDMIDCECDTDCIAAVSAGSSSHHPNHEVLKAYIESGWVTLHTHPRHNARSATSYGFEWTATARTATRNTDVEAVWIDIDLNDGKVAWQPQSCRVDESNLPLYEKVI